MLLASTFLFASYRNNKKWVVAFCFRNGNEKQIFVSTISGQACIWDKVSRTYLFKKRTCYCYCSWPRFSRSNSRLCCCCHLKSRRDDDFWQLMKTHSRYRLGIQPESGAGVKECNTVSGNLNNERLNSKLLTFNRSPVQ